MLHIFIFQIELVHYWVDLVLRRNYTNQINTSIANQKGSYDL